MELKDALPGRPQSEPVPSYRFGDFTQEELRLIGMSLLERIKTETKAVERLSIGLCRNIAMGRKELLSRLYNECKAAHQQAVADEENNQEGWWR